MVFILRESVEVPEENKQSGDNRFRNWCCEVYPESAPSNWLQILSGQHIPALVSPLHEFDHNEIGELKKPHFHILMCFEGKKSYDQFKEYASEFKGVVPPLKKAVVASVRGYARYLCHLDDPDKWQYDVSQIKALSGADYETYTTLPSDVAFQVKLMQGYIRKVGIRSFSVFMDICAKEFPDWHYLICNRCTNIIKEYLKSVSFDFKESSHGQVY